MIDLRACGLFANLFRFFANMLDISDKREIYGTTTMAYDKDASIRAIRGISSLLEELHVDVRASIQVCRENRIDGFETGWSRIDGIVDRINSIAEDCRGLPLCARPLTLTHDAGVSTYFFAGLRIEQDALGDTLDSFETVERALEGYPRDRNEATTYFIGPRHAGVAPDMKSLVTATSPTEAMMLYLASKTDLSRAWAITPDMDLDLENLELRSLHDWEKHDVEQVFQSACVVLDPYLGWNAMYDNEPGF
jgi:hypothetical protein